MFKGVDGNLVGVVHNLDGDFNGVTAFDLEDGDLESVACCLVGVWCDFLYGDFDFAVGDLSVTPESVAVNSR